ncbi:MAG: ribbon-helix-helix domain-containing protein [Desulfurococcaceae archaeon]
MAAESGVPCFKSNIREILRMVKGMFVRPRLRLVTVKMPEIYLEGIDELIKIGRYKNRSEVIRVAIRELLRRELWIREAELS